LYLVDRHAPGLVCRDGVLVDSQPVAALSLRGTPARRIAGAGTDAIVHRALRSGAVARAAWMAGALRQALDVTVDYLKVREQFGVPIGAFQALQHRVARLHCDALLATAVVARTADALDGGDPRADRMVHACQAHVTDTYRRIAEEGVQLHGGLGMTDEAEIGFHLKAARVAEVDFGDVRHHRARYAELAGY
jgi:alkylation response protein AidB-like acyl-CoA dehydrogenase